MRVSLIEAGRLLTGDSCSPAIGRGTGMVTLRW
jgi:hypothetical protein